MQVRNDLLPEHQRMRFLPCLGATRSLRKHSSHPSPFFFFFVVFFCTNRMQAAGQVAARRPGVAPSLLAWGRSHRCPGRHGLAASRMKSKSSETKWPSSASDCRRRNRKRGAWKVCGGQGMRGTEQVAGCILMVLRIDGSPPPFPDFLACCLSAPHLPPPPFFHYYA